MQKIKIYLISTLDNDLEVKQNVFNETFKKEYFIRTLINELFDNLVNNINKSSNLNSLIRRILY